MEKKVFPREKTCGDGLTPRAVRQIADMGLEASLTGAHRYQGLRANAYGKVLDLPWPEHPSFPSYGYVITRHDLDQIVNERAEKAGATVWQGTEAVAPILADAPDRARARAAGVIARRGRDLGSSGPGGGSQPALLPRGRGEGQGERADPGGPGSLRRGGRRGQLPLRPDAGHGAQPEPAHGHGPPWLLPLARPRPRRSSSPTWTSGTRMAKWCPAMAGSSPSATGVSTWGWACSPPTAAGRASTPPASWTSSWTGRPKDWELSPETCLGPPTGGKLPMGLSVGPRVGPHRVGHRGRRRLDQPVQRRGHRLRLRDRAAGRGVAG